MTTAAASSAAPRGQITSCVCVDVLPAASLYVHVIVVLAVIGKLTLVVAVMVPSSQLSVAVGKPDMVFRRFNAVCFVHGCFWHHHEGCRFATTPATRPDYWLGKFEGNQARDKAATRSLQESGWRVAVVWECDLKGDGATTTAERVARWLESDETTFHSDDGFAPSEEASVVETSS